MLKFACITWLPSSYIVIFLLWRRIKGMGTFLYCAFMIFLMIAVIVAAVYVIRFISRLGNDHGISAADEERIIKHEI
jgi:membrane protein implicated in regulation of membrane protease activity